MFSRKAGFLVVLLLIFTSVFAQNSFSNNSFFGLKAGVNSSSLSGKSTRNDVGRELEVQSKIGFYISGFYKHELSSKYAIQPEILFSHQVTRIDIQRWEGIPVEAGSDIHLPYILVPVVFQYYPIGKLSLELGPQLGYNLGKFITIKGTVNLNNETYDLEERLNDIARWDFSILAGIGYDLNENFSTKLRFAQGFKSLDQRESDAFELYHQVLSFGLEYKL